ncbi:MAG: hypothetical protein WC128_01000 [Bacteroidales bacterium]
MDGKKLQVHPQKRPYMWMNGKKPAVHPQKRPYMWMDGKKLQVHPQKQPYMWMDGKKLQVHPQKRLYTWINIMNSDCCHKKEPGASAYKKAPGFFGGDKRKAVAAVWKLE